MQSGGLILLDGVEAQGAGAAFYQQTVDCAPAIRDRPSRSLRPMRCGAGFPSLFCRMAHRGISSRAPGFCFRRKCIAAQLRVARENRAELRTGEIVTEVIADSSQVMVQTNRSRYAAAGVVLSPGAWMAEWARKICGLKRIALRSIGKLSIGLVYRSRAHDLCRSRCRSLCGVPRRWRRGFMVFPV